MQFSTKPEVIGPGTWYTLHIMSWEARTPEEIKCFIKFLRATINKFPCGDCRNHAQGYLKMNPPDDHKYIYKGQDLSMFHYINQFHNYPNKRLGKRIVTFQEAFDAMTSENTGFCEEGCEEDGNEVLPTKVPARKVYNQYTPYVPAIKSNNQQFSIYVSPGTKN